MAKIPKRDMSDKEWNHIVSTGGMPRDTTDKEMRRDMSDKEFSRIVTPGKKKPKGGGW